MITTCAKPDTSMSSVIEPTAKPVELQLANPAFSKAQSFAAVARSDLSITVKNGIATLSGNTESLADANMVEYLVSRMKDVTRVINLISYA